MKSPTKLWNPVYVFVLGLFLTLLPASVLLFINWRRMGKRLYGLLTLLAGLGLFMLELWLSAVLADDQTYWISLVHVLGPFFLCFAQKSHYDRWYDEERADARSFAKPIFLGVLGMGLAVLAYVGWNNYQMYQLNVRMNEALQAYEEGRFRESLQLLQAIDHDYQPFTALYQNMALNYLALGQKDSAIWVMEQWLLQMPEDAEALHFRQALEWGHAAE